MHSHELTHNPSPSHRARVSVLAPSLSLCQRGSVRQAHTIVTPSPSAHTGTRARTQPISHHVKHPFLYTSSDPPTHVHALRLDTLDTTKLRTRSTLPTINTTCTFIVRPSLAQCHVFFSLTDCTHSWRACICMLKKPPPPMHMQNNFYSGLVPE